MMRNRDMNNKERNRVFVVGLLEGVALGFLLATLFVAVV